MIPGSVCGLYLRYDLRNLRPQCYGCNVNRGGMGAAFVHKMEKIEGTLYVNEIFADQKRTIYNEREFLESKLREYEGLLGHRM